MASTYENDLRLEEMATGENSGSWGTKTNTNLELIADAFSYGTETIADADTTITIADGAADAARSLALKINSSADLTTTRTITLAPNTTSKVWIIENNTSGGQTLTISAGSGSNITLANGKTKIIATDGIGAGSNVVELTQDLAIADLFVDDDLTVGDDIIMNSDGGILKIGADADLQVTHSGTAGTITNATGDLTLDVASDIILDAASGVIKLHEAGNGIFGSFTRASGSLSIKSEVSDADMFFKGNDGGATITALTLDMSEAGAATFNSGVTLSGDLTVDTDTLYVDSTNNRVGIRESAPDTLLHLTGTSTAYTNITMEQSDTTLATDQPVGQFLFKQNDASGAGTPAKFGAYADSVNGEVGLRFYTGSNDTATEAMRIDSSQRVLIGAGTARADLFNTSATASLQVEGTTGNTASASIVRNSNDDNGPQFILGKSNGTSVGSDTIVTDDALLGRISYQGADGSELVEGARIEAQVDGTPAANDMPGRLQFYTTAAGSASPTERMRINNAGDVGIGGARDPDTPLHIYTAAVAITPLIKLQANVSTNDSSAGASIDFVASGDNTATGSRIIGTRAASGANMDLRFHTARNNFAMLIDTSQRVLIAQTTARNSFFGNNVGTYTPRFQIEANNTSNGNRMMSFVLNDDSNNAFIQIFGRSRGTTANSLTAVAEDDNLGILSWQGATGSTLTEAAQIKAEVDGTVSASAMPGRLVFRTTADGNSSSSERMRITNEGYVGINSSGNGTNRLAVYTGTSNGADIAHFMGYEFGLSTLTIQNAVGSNNGRGISIDMKAGNNDMIGRLTVAHSGSTNNSAMNIQVEEDNAAVTYMQFSGDSQRVNIYRDLNFVNNGDGINFGASSGGGSTSTILDDYEEGTWTPRYTAASGGNLGGTQQSLGRYTKIGRMVHVKIYIYINNISVSGKSGAVHISGLPFTVADVGASSANATSTTQSTATFGAFATAPTHATTEVGTTQIDLFKPLASQAENKLQVTDFATGGGNRNYLRFDMTYETS